MQILMSFQSIEDGQKMPKVIALAQSERTHHINHSRCGTSYYMLWGTSDDFMKSGIQQLKTKNDRNVGLNQALKSFNMAVQSMKFITFSKIKETI